MIAGLKCSSTRLENMAMIKSLRLSHSALWARAAIRDVGRVMDIPLSEVDRVAKMIPNVPGKPVTIEQALQDITEFKQVYQEASYLQELIDTARQMEGVVRNAGTHAAGVIITDRPTIEYLPLHRPTGSSAGESPCQDRDTIRNERY